MKQRMHDFLVENKDVNLGDVAYTLQVGRQPFAHSTVVVGQDRETLLEKLNQPSANISTLTKGDKAVVFMFPGGATNTSIWPVSCTPLTRNSAK